jgi:hypothetical protein
VLLTIDIQTPASGLVTAADTIDVNGTIGTGVVTVQVSGVAASVGGSGFSATVPLRSGPNMLVAIATDADGNTGTDSVQVTRDIIAPNVQINSPPDGFQAIVDRVTVTGVVNDIVSGGLNPQVTVNGIEAFVQQGTFMVMDVPLVRGPNTIVANATDSVGNEDTTQIQVSFDPPAGAKLEPFSGNGQAGLVGATLAEPLIVRLVDDSGNALASRVVRFDVLRSDGMLFTAAQTGRLIEVTTDGAGFASVMLMLGNRSGEGNNQVRASSVGASGEALFCATAQPALPNQILAVMGDNQKGLAGSPLPEPFEVLVVDDSGNPVAGVPVTYSVLGGGGNFDGDPDKTVGVGADGVARAVLTLGPEEGISINIVAVTFPDNAGLPATFISTALVAGLPADTRFAGVVLDNTNTPIPDATVHIEGSAGDVLTNVEGQFRVEGVPVGAIHLEIDPSTSPRPETFPTLAFEATTVAGRINRLPIGPIRIPPLVSDAMVVGGAEDVVLRMPGVLGLTLTVFANSASFPDGSSTGLVSINQVHLDKVPMPPPSGTFFMPPAWTVQPPGVQFDPPARVTIPNDGLLPGRVIDIFQFDHDLNRFVNIGPGTVDEQGLIIASDPGFGITKAGWGGCGQPTPPNTCACNCNDNNQCTQDICSGQPNCNCSFPPTTGSCDDGNTCTMNDQCTPEGCKGTPVAVGTACGGATSDMACTIDACNAAGECITGEPKPDGTECDDEMFCTDPDQCQSGACGGMAVEEGSCAPIVVNESITFGPYDIIVAEIPETSGSVDLTVNASKKCCEEREIREAIELDGDGTFSASGAGLNVGLPGAGTLARLIDKVICKRIIEKIPFIKASCKVGVDVKIDGVEIDGTIGVTDSECRDLTQWRGNGTVGITGLELDIAVEIGIGGQKLGAGLNGTDDVSGRIRAAEQSLLVTFQDAGVTVTGSITLPVFGPLPLDHTFPPFPPVGPFSVPAPSVPRVCL